MKKCLLRVTAYVLTVLLLLSGVSVAAAPAGAAASNNLPTQLGVDEYTDASNIDTYVQVAAGDGATLFADMTSGKIALRNDKTGYIWYNVPNNRLQDTVTVGTYASQLDSALVVGYVDIAAEAFLTGVTYLYSYDVVAAGKVKVEEIENGIRVTYDFDSTGFRIPVDYTLDKGTLVTSVAFKDVLVNEAFLEAKRKEGWTKEDEEYMFPSHLVSLWLNPGLGAQNTAQNGYVFIPDGSGALVDFKPGAMAPNTVYTKTVYGEEKAQTVTKIEDYGQDVHLPVFGTVVDNNALCGIIEEGDSISSIMAFGATQGCNYTGVSCRANLRDLYTAYLYQGTNNERQVSRVSLNDLALDVYRVRYTMLSGEDASYMGMAQLYRDYLVKQKNLTKKDTKAALNVDLINCVETDANFLGFTYKKKLALTTFDQAGEILDTLQEAGVDSIASRLLGWTNNGVMNRTPSIKATPLSILGGKKAFQALAEKATAAGAFYPNEDLVRLQKSAGGISARRASIKSVVGLPVYEYSYIPSALVYDMNKLPSRLLSGNGLQAAAEKFKKNYEKLQCPSLALDTLTNYCYSDFGKKGLYRDEMMGVYTDILQDYASTMRLEGVKAQAYAVPYLERVLDIPLDSSQYDFFDAEIPFYSLVFHGYVALAGGDMNRSFDTHLSFLKSVESGSELHYSGMYEDAAQLKDTAASSYYSTTYTLWKDEAVALWAEYKPLLSQIHNSVITSYDRLTNDVVRTVYENGVTVYVNYADKAYTAPDGTVVKAKGFAYTGGEQG